MSDEENSFAARRARYLAKQGIDGGTGDPAAPRAYDPYDRPVRPRRASGPSVTKYAVGCVAVLGFGMYMLAQGTAAVEGVRESGALANLQARFFGVTNMADGKAVRRKGAPEPMRELGDRGWEHRSPSVAHAGEEELLVHAVAAGLPVASGPIPEGVPAEVVPLAPNPSCAIRRRDANERVAGVRIGEGSRPGGVTVIADAAVTAQVLKNVTEFTELSRWTASADRRIGVETAGERLSVVDVFVTDTAGPVHLVLQSMWQPVLWNLHAAPGVRIAGASIVTPAFGGIAGHGDAPVDVLRVADGCAKPIYRKPEPHWGYVAQAARSNAGVHVNQMNLFRQGYAAYDSWYSGAFGVSAGGFTVTPEEADHVLIGPVPAEPVPFTPLSRRTAAVIADDHVLVGTVAGREEAARALHDGRLLQAAGGDLSAVDPAPLERPAL